MAVEMRQELNGSRFRVRPVGTLQQGQQSMLMGQIRERSQVCLARRRHILQLPGIGTSVPEEKCSSIVRECTEMRPLGSMPHPGRAACNRAMLKCFPAASFPGREPFIHNSTGSESCDQPGSEQLASRGEDPQSIAVGTLAMVPSI